MKQIGEWNCNPKGIGYSPQFRKIMTPREYMERVREYGDKGLVTQNIVELHRRYSESWMFGLTEIQKSELMTRKRLGVFPSWEMFSPDGTMEAIDETPV